MLENHFISIGRMGMKYVEHTDPCCDNANSDKISIDDMGYKEFGGAYQYAMDMTKKRYIRQ